MQEIKNNQNKNLLKNMGMGDIKEEAVQAYSRHIY
jgi:hypothetical protein